MHGHHIKGLEAIASFASGIEKSTGLLVTEGLDLFLLRPRRLDCFGSALRGISPSVAACLSALLNNVGRLFSGSALTDDVEVPHGHYVAENMTVTVDPNRNAIMLSVAYGVAVARNAQIVAAAVHAGDHYVYPDCRPGFVEAFDAMQRQAVEGFGDPNLRLYAPFVHKTKAEIVEVGARLGVPYEDTWSCYEGGELHCSLCGACNEREVAFRLAGVPDPTKYRGRDGFRE